MIDNSIIIKDVYEKTWSWDDKMFYSSPYSTSFTAVKKKDVEALKKHLFSKRKRDLEESDKVFFPKHVTYSRARFNNYAKPLNARIVRKLESATVMVVDFLEIASKYSYNDLLSNPSEVCQVYDKNTDNYLWASCSSVNEAQAIYPDRFIIGETYINLRWENRQYQDSLIQLLEIQRDFPDLETISYDRIYNESSKGSISFEEATKLLAMFHVGTDKSQLNMALNLLSETDPVKMESDLAIYVKTLHGLSSQGMCSTYSEAVTKCKVLKSTLFYHFTFRHLIKVNYKRHGSFDMGLYRLSFYHSLMKMTANEPIKYMYSVIRQEIANLVIRNVEPKNITPISEDLAFNYLSSFIGDYHLYYNNVFNVRDNREADATENLAGFTPVDFSRFASHITDLPIYTFPSKIKSEDDKERLITSFKVVNTFLGVNLKVILMAALKDCKYEQEEQVCRSQLGKEVFEQAKRALPKYRNQ